MQISAEGGPRRLPWGTVVYLAAGGLTALAAATGCFGQWEPTAMFSLGLATLIALVVSTLRQRPSRIWPWAAIATALGLFLAGGVARSTLNTLGNLTASRSLLPDMLALPGYALLAAGLLGFSLVGNREPHRRASIVLDGLIAALSLATLAWVFAIQPVLHEHQAPLPVKLVLTAYPSLSIFLVVVTLRIAFNPERDHVPAFWFMLAGMTCMFVGDVAYMFADINLLHVPQQLLDLPYALAYLGAGATALHPSMRRLTEPGHQQHVATPLGRIVLVAVALLLPAPLALRQGGVSAGDRVIEFLLILALGTAAVLRVVQALNVAKRSEMRLVFQATHDALTGLPNRRMMEQRVSQLLRESAGNESHLALLYVDLDRFKLINDTLGHSHGDELLIEVAGRLCANVRPNDLVSRIGGDEFMIVLDHAAAVSRAMEVADRLRSCLRVPFDRNGMKFYVSGSIGVALADSEGCEATVESLVRSADTAMYRAKEAGRDAVAVFDETMRTRVSQQVELERDLRSAVALKQLTLVYQPIVALPRGPTVGVEALVRWAHPGHGVILPAKFIPLAEETGLIVEIGAWVMEEAARQFAAWCRQSPKMKNLYMSVNLSGAQLRDEHIVGQVADVLTAYGLDGRSLCLEH